MRIIREPDGNRIMIFPLLLNWGITDECHVARCSNRPSTIVIGLNKRIPKLAICEEHYQQGNVPGGTTMTYDLGILPDALENNDGD